MCFSATASFIVGGSLLAVGVVTLKMAEERRELAFAAILSLIIYLFFRGRRQNPVT